MNKVKTKGWLGQPSIIRSLEKKFSDEAMKHRLGFTPGTPRFIAMRVADEEDKLPANEHAIYRSGVGTLYLTKHSRSFKTHQAKLVWEKDEITREDS